MVVDSMMTDECRVIADLLPALPDGELPADDLKRVEAHLVGCATCRAEAEALRRISTVLRSEPLPDVSLPTGSQAAAWIMERERSARPWWRDLRLVWGSLAATAAVTAFFFLNSSPAIPLGGSPNGVNRAANAADALPALVVMDDEKTGRQVLLAPAPDAQGMLR